MFQSPTIYEKSNVPPFITTMVGKWWHMSLVGKLGQTTVNPNGISWCFPSLGGPDRMMAGVVGNWDDSQVCRYHNVPKTGIQNGRNDILHDVFKSHCIPLPILVCFYSASARWLILTFLVKSDIHLGVTIPCLEVHTPMITHDSFSISPVSEFSIVFPLKHDQLADSTLIPRDS